MGNLRLESSQRHLDVLNSMRSGFSTIEARDASMITQLSHIGQMLEKVYSLTNAVQKQCESFELRQAYLGDPDVGSRTGTATPSADSEGVSSGIASDRSDTISLDTVPCELANFVSGCARTCKEASENVFADPDRVDSCGTGDDACGNVCAQLDTASQETDQEEISSARGEVMACLQTASEETSDGFAVECDDTCKYEEGCSASTSEATYDEVSIERICDLVYFTTGHIAALDAGSST